MHGNTPRDATPAIGTVATITLASPSIHDMSALVACIERKYHDAHSPDDNMYAEPRKHFESEPGNRLPGLLDR